MKGSIGMVRALRCPLTFFLFTLVWGTALVATCGAQSKSATDENQAASTKPGFAIESEMLTYSAMDAEGSQLACGIARNVGVADEGCNARGGTGATPGVVVVTNGSSAMAEFQLWRTDISTMEMLTLRADHYCSGTRGGLISTLESVASMIPEGQAIQLAQALLTTTVETAPVEGDILDQTLVNNVGGHLKGLGVSVVIPDVYMPRSLTAIDQAHSPFLTAFVALVKARSCVAPAVKEREKERVEEKKLPGVGPAAGGEACPPGTEKAEDVVTERDKLSIAQAIDGFMSSLTAPVSGPAPKTEEGAAAAPAPPASSISHLSAVLRADGLAQALDAVAPDARSGANSNWYVLWLKALESGGTFMKSGNAILGTKTSYSGGSVGTYSLFKLDGNLACSGVFYNYSGPVLTTTIPKLLQSATPMQGGKLVGGCGPAQK